MSSSVELEQRQIKTDELDLFPRGDLTFTRQLVVRKKLRDVTFRAVKDSDKLCEARDLLNDRYGWRGYGSTHNIPYGPNHTTFTAEVDESIVGTITLAIDSEFGLNLDDTFGVEVDQIRRVEGSNICELTRLAFDCGARSREMMAGLFHFAFIYGTMISECTDLLIEVNPRHACYYETMLGFERIGALKTNGSVAAPAQLMNLKVDAIRRSISKLAGSAAPTSHRSLYSNFFPPLQEAQIRGLLSYSSTLRHVRHDSRYLGHSYSMYTGEARIDADAKEPFDPAAITAKTECDVTAPSDVRQAA
jgi:hypothetical protein